MTAELTKLVDLYETAKRLAFKETRTYEAYQYALLLAFPKILSHIQSLEAEVEKWKTASADWNKAAINNMKMAEEYEQQLARSRKETAWFQQKASQLADYAEHKVSCRLHKSRDLEELDKYIDTGIDNRKCNCGLQEIM